MKVMVFLAVIAVAAIAFLLYLNWRKKQIAKSTSVQARIVEQTQADLAAYRKAQEPKVEKNPYVVEGKTSLNNIQRSIPQAKPRTAPRKSTRSKSSSNYGDSFDTGTYDYGTSYSSYDSGSSYSSGSSSYDSGSSSSSSDSGSSGGCD